MTGGRKPPKIVVCRDADAASITSINGFALLRWPTDDAVSRSTDRCTNWRLIGSSPSASIVGQVCGAVAGLPRRVSTRGLADWKYWSTRKPEVTSDWPIVSR